MTRAMQNRDARWEALRRAMAAADLDVVAIVPGSNFIYLTGGTFGAMERPTVLIIPREGEARMVLPFFEEATWNKLQVDARVHLWRDQEGYDGAFRAAADGLKPRRIGVEGQRMRVFEENAVAAALGGVVIDAHAVISAMRLRKDATEIAALRKAIGISERALASTLPEVRVGMSEQAVEGSLLRHLFAAGARSLAFPPIVVAGPNAAEAHASASDYRIRSGDTLLFDFGAVHEGYNADVTRTVFVGEPNSEARAMYAIVEEANRIGREAARPGVTASEVDDITTLYLEQSPFRQHILSKTGHGLGLDVHEAPQIMRGNHQVLEPGMVCTIEPGLYPAAVRGIRIEDDVVITAEGAESLTEFPRGLRVVG